MKKRRRRQFIVNPIIQYKLLFLILISIIIPTLLTFMSLFFLIRSILLEAQINNELVYNALLFLSRKVYIILLAGFSFVSVLLLMWALIFIHRIVGPLYRLERELDNIIDGKKINKIRFRKNDSFLSLADKINRLVDMIPKEK